MNPSQGELFIGWEPWNKYGCDETLMNKPLTGGKLLSLETGSESGCLSVCQYGTDG